MRKVMTIVGTRPELVKMSLVIPKLDQAFNHVLVHTGQNYDYELNQIFFDDMGIRRPDHFLDVAGHNAAATIADVILKADAVLEQEAPEALLLYGDTNSCLSIIAAKRRRIPVFHMEAGNRCFDQRVPEELNRKIVDHLADINIVLTEHARRHLLAEGLPSDRIFRVGSHMQEVLGHFRAKVEQSRILQTLQLAEDKYFVVSLHREENVDPQPRLIALLETLNAVALAYGFPVVFSTHPRTRKRMEALSARKLSPLVRLLPPFGFTDYIRLQMGAHCVISDSGTITEESALLNIPAVTVRDAHERPEGMDAGTLIMCDIDPGHVLDAIRIVRQTFDRDGGYRVPDYEEPQVSTKIVRIVASYIDFVRANVWRDPTG